MTEATATPEQLHEARLDAFFAGLAPTIEAQRRLDRLVATGFSVFHYFKKRNNQLSDINENRLSGIFADLLRPNGTHGQGVAFLRLFLQEIDLGGKPDIRRLEAYGPLEQCSVVTEFSIKGGRVDIVLKLGKMWIGVENKPWTVEREKQLQDYLEYLQGNDKGACVLYLSGSGEEAATIDDDAHYLNMPYGRTRNGPSVAHWIAECHKHCEAENVRWFLKDLLQYIGRRFYFDPEEPL